MLIKLERPGRKLQDMIDPRLTERPAQARMEFEALAWSPNGSLVALESEDTFQEGFAAAS